jgi:hypothetical protein
MPDWREATTLRPGSSVAVGVVGGLAGTALLVADLLSSHRDWTVIGSIALALVLLWLFVVRPSAQVSDRGIRLVNPLQVVELTWPAIGEVRSKWALELVASGQSHTAWGVPAETGRPRRTGGAVRRGGSRRSGAPAPRGRERTRVEAHVVAAEIKALIHADRRRTDGATPKVARCWWDPLSIGLLALGLAGFVGSLFVG